MAVSTIRTLVWQPPTSGSMLPIRYRWPVKNQAEVLDYSMDMTAWVADVADPIVSAAAANMPSGAGELQLSELSLNGNVVTFWASGGVPGRLYTISLSGETVSGRIFAELPTLFIDDLLAAYPLYAPPNAGFSTPLETVGGDDTSLMLFGIL